jgi:N-acetyl-anhydromuramyl-L-alanine amidase AmpD
MEVSIMSKALDNIPVILCNRANYGELRDASAVRYLVYHYTGNDGDTARANAVYYANATVKASAHYFVDGTEIVQSVPELYTAWSVGGKKWRDCAQTGGGMLHGVVTNTNSISIEMCDTAHDGKLMATDATLRNAAALGRKLMALYGIPIDRVVRHFDVTGKHCPAYFMDSAAWEAFRLRLTGKEDETMDRYNSLQEIREHAPWAVETVEKLIASGAIRGVGANDDKGRPADMDLNADMLRLLVICDRAGSFGGGGEHKPL